MRLLRGVLVGLLAVVWAGWVAWGALALWIDGPASRPLAGLLAGGLVVVSLRLVLRRGSRWLGMLASSVLVALVAAWWLRIPARNDRNWVPEVSQLASIDVHGDVLTVHNLRNFDYRTETDFTPHWEVRTYDLNQLRGFDLFLSFWGPTQIAHTIASWDFGDGQHLAISIETRREQGEVYSAGLGFFRQFEVYYVVADERDLVGLRTNYRGEQVFLYRLAAGPARARALLMAYVDEINHLVQHPEWYNALTQNCTTSIEILVERALGPSGDRFPWDWRLIANGHLGELLYERGSVNTTMSYEELRKQSDITSRGRAADGAADFSERIRDGLPARPPPRN